MDHVQKKFFKINHYLLIMNVSIGLRSKPDSVIYSVIEEKENGSKEIIIIDKLILPVALQLPEQLKFIRSTFLDIILENKINRACIRITESTAQKIFIERINIEAVLQELIASSTIEKYYVGQISTISAKLKFERSLFKEYVENKHVYPHIENWSNYSKEERESILSALSALNL